MWVVHGIQQPISAFTISDSEFSKKKLTNHIVSVCKGIYLHSCQNNLIDWKIQEYFVLFFREKLWWPVHSNTNPERYMKISLTSIKVKLKVYLAFCDQKRQQYKIPWVYQNNMLRHWILLEKVKWNSVVLKSSLKFWGTEYVY